MGLDVGEPGARGCRIEGLCDSDEDDIGDGEVESVVGLAVAAEVNLVGTGCSPDGVVEGKGEMPAGDVEGPAEKSQRSRRNTDGDTGIDMVTLAMRRGCF